jgi:FkbM family methyltransferase
MRTDNIHAMYDDHTLLIMRMVLSRNSNCIDVGAHAGEILREMLALAPEGRHYAFEPIPYLFEGLAANEAFRSARILNTALSDSAGETTFFWVRNDPAYSGLKQRRYDRADPDIQEIRVEVARLDDIVPSDHKIDLIKIDVEGAELPVMRGAERVIREFQPFVIFESGLGASDRYGTNGSLLYDFLAQRCGLEINTLDGFLGGAGGLTRDELIDVFDTTSRYYFIAHRRLSDAERAVHLRKYILDIDSRLHRMQDLHARTQKLERMLEASFSRLEVRVFDWGPRQATIGQGVNLQPDGSSAMWIRAENVSPLGEVLVYFGDRPASYPATVRPDLVTTEIPREVIDRAGNHDVCIREASGRTTRVGTFEVSARCD